MWGLDTKARLLRNTSYSDFFLHLSDYVVFADQPTFFEAQIGEAGDVEGSCLFFGDQFGNQFSVDRALHESVS